MLSSTSVSNGKVSLDGSEDSGCQPLEFPQIDPQSVNARNAFYRRRTIRTVPLGEHTLTIAPEWRKELPEIADAWTLKISIDQQPLELVITGPSVVLLFGELASSVDLEALAPEHCALLLEHALSDILASIEAHLGVSLTIQSARKTPDFRSSDHPNTFLLMAGFDGGPASWCLLRTDPQSVLRLTEGLDRISGAPSDPLDLPVPTHVRWAAVDLSLNELKSLMPGDIVLVDYNCSEHETAMAVIGDRLVAPVKAVPNGYQLLKQPVPHQESEATWCWSNLPAQTASLEDGGAPDDIPLRLYAELAQLNLSYAKLRDLKPGTVIESEQPFSTNVDLVVGNSRIGQGEPTTIGNGLGVRIMRK